MPAPGPVDSLQEQARRAFRNGDFVLAEVLLTKAITIHAQSPELALFDLRAACLEHLGRLREALGDAKAAINVDRKDARGYLRIGKIYQLLDQDVKALQWYDRGWEITRGDDSRRGLLKKIRSQLDERLAGGRPGLVDPCKLPIELFSEILSYLSFSKRMTCRRVSKLWNRAIQSDYKTYECIDLLTERRRAAKLAHLEAYLKSACGRTTHLRTALSIASIKPLLKLHCKQKLRALEAGSSPTFEISSELSELRLLHLLTDHVGLQRCISYIERLKYLMIFKATVSSDDLLPISNFEPSCPALQVLDLGHTGHIPFKGVELISSKFPDLKELILPSISVMGSDQESIIEKYPVRLTKLCVGSIVTSTAVSLTRELIIPQTVRELDVGCKYVDLNLDPPPIHSLSLRRCGPRTISWTDHAADVWSALRQLHLVSHDMTYESLKTVAASTGSLREFSVTTQHASSAMNDEVLRLFSDKNPGLMTLNLTGCRDITGAGLAATVHAQPSLKCVIIKGCPEISQDVIGWMRQKGLMVIARGENV